MIYLTLALVLVALGGNLGVFLWTRDRFERAETAPPSTYDDRAILTALDVHDDRISGQQSALQTLAEKIHDQNLAISEGIERVDRAERRVRAAVTRAKNRMEELGFEDDAITAEVEGLRELDESASGSEAMQPVLPGLEPPEGRDMSAFPGSW